jgi:F-type H+-transporting ATPase subunit a
MHGLHFFSLLLLQGVPMSLAPFLVLLELIFYRFCTLSLGIRLFVNMMAGGHSLVKILSGFAWTMLPTEGIMNLAHLAPFLIVFTLTCLQLGVTILQAYVFTILINIYLNDVINLH